VRDCVLDFSKTISTRTEKIGSVIQRAIAPLMMEYAEEYGLITISEVQVLPDLSEARVYVHSTRSMKRLVENLNLRAGHIKKEISKHLTQKRTPVLRFEIDLGSLASKHIDELLEK